MVGVEKEVKGVLVVFGVIVFFWVINILLVVVIGLMVLFLIFLSGSMFVMDIYVYFGNKVVFFVLGVFILVSFI